MTHLIIKAVTAISFFMPFCFNASAGDMNNGFYTVMGTVLSATDGEAVSFALISIEDLNLNTVCDIEGKFIMQKVPEGEHIFLVNSLGFSPKNIKLNVHKNKELIIKLSVSSIALPEFEVMAKKYKRNKLIVDERAIEYIQPTSLSDVLLLLPGNVYKENNMSGFEQITSRQAGSDANTSLGVAILTDGAPVSNDGMRTQMVGVTANSMLKVDENLSYTGDSQIRGRTGMNQGVDMRYISTDHIQSVEFTRGISSAKYGNLSSGLIQVQSKYGVTPLRVRIKMDMKNNLVYVGKGFKLSDKAGTLHLGVDYLNSQNDVREEMDKFTRITAQAYYNNRFKIGKTSLGLDMKLNQTISINKMKKDELTYEYNEIYRGDYSKTSLLLKSDWTINRSWLEKLDLLMSSDVVWDKITRHMMVLSSSGPLNVPLAKEEGEHEGAYLPGKYYSDFYIENIPVNYFTQVNAISRFHPGNNSHVNVFYGLEYRYTKNKGEGAVMEDETRPPFPYDNSYMRPRPNYQIPALSVGAAYLQADFLYTKGKNLLKMSVGGRLTQMFNLANDYALSGKVLAEPRVNVSWTIGQDMKNTFRAGYGEENKLPTLDYLYPEKIYKDFYMLNAYSNKEEFRRLITYTTIYDVANKEIRENRNRKIEAGWDFEYRKFDISLTVFYEKTSSGFEYLKHYAPLTYNLYRTLKPGADISNRIPQKEDYKEEVYSIFTTFSRVMNSKRTTKKGIEYRIILPKIEPLSTNVEVNGAFYKSNYGSVLPYYYYPNKTIANQAYPYVGIYDINPENEYRRFNTNIWLNTHIPMFKLIFTNFIQLVWISSSQYKDSRQKYPFAYFSFDGTVRNITETERTKIDSDDMVFRHLKKSKLPIEYARDSKPVSLLWNIKAMKEFNNYARLSFFVNGIVDINPKYTTGGKTTDRDWTDPYFGIELLLIFNL